MVLKATAGLRLLPEDKAKALLKEVRRRRRRRGGGGEVEEDVEVFFFCHSDSLAQKERDGKTTEQPLRTSVGGKIKRIWVLLGGR